MSTTCNTCNTCKSECGCIPTGVTTPNYCISDTPPSPPNPPCSETFDGKCLIYTGVNDPGTGTESGQSFNTVIENILTNGFFKYEIGQYVESEGGIIVDRWLSTAAFDAPEKGPVQNYLVMDKDNLGELAWSDVDPDPLQTSLVNGYQNTIDIINAGLTPTANYAAKACELSTTGGKSDWYLPSVLELELIYKNRFAIQYTLETVLAVPPFMSDLVIYSSSTTFFGKVFGFAFNADSFGVNVSGSTNINNVDLYYVKAFRRFSIS